MVHGVEFQEAVLFLMKSQSPITAIVGEEVRERNWMGRDFGYPAVRVQILRETPPVGPGGECTPLIGDVFFTIVCHAKGDNTLECLTLMDAVQTGLRGKRLPTSQYIIPRTRISFVEYVWPVSEGERVWRGEVQARTQVKESGWEA